MVSEGTLTADRVHYVGGGVGWGGNTPVMRGTPPLSLCDSALSPPSFDCLLLSGRALCRSPTGEGLRERDETQHHSWHSLKAASEAAVTV